MERYFECYGINKQGKFDTQYVSFIKMFGFGNDNQTFTPKKTALKKHSDFKAIHYFIIYYLRSPIFLHFTSALLTTFLPSLSSLFSHSDMAICAALGTFVPITSLR